MRAHLMRGSARSWRELVSTRKGFTFTWQDLDGLHLTTSPPTEPPCTSLIHAWSDDGTLLVRARLYDEHVWEAALTTTGEGEIVQIRLVPTLTWGTDSGRLGSFRSPDGDRTMIENPPAQVEVLDDSGRAVTFLVQAGKSSAWGL